MASQGWFVTFEGPEGSGKSTQLGHVATRLRDAGHDVTCTREPGGTDAGERVRDVLLDPGHEALLPTTEALLFSAARAELVARVVRPALHAGHIVLCDRYADSTSAYQGYGRGVSRSWLDTLTHGATGGLVPDLTLLFDLPAEVGLARRRTAGGEWNRLDGEDLAFHQAVREGFLQLAAAEPARWVVLEADRPENAVTAQAWTAIASLVDGTLHD
jgi:dTMP kinase